jgi:hypothetical protein
MTASLHNKIQGMLYFPLELGVSVCVWYSLVALPMLSVYYLRKLKIRDKMSNHIKSQQTFNRKQVLSCIKGSRGKTSRYIAIITIKANKYGGGKGMQMHTEREAKHTDNSRTE